MKRRHHIGRKAGREGGRKGVEQNVVAAAAAAAAARTGATALGKDLPSTFTLCRGIWEGIKAAVRPTKPTKATANELLIGAILFLLLLLLLLLASCGGGVLAGQGTTMTAMPRSDPVLLWMCRVHGVGSCVCE